MESRPRQNHRGEKQRVPNVGINPLEEVAVALIPYLVGLFVLLFFIIVIPELTMFLPQIMR
jgi:TRAP-type C4-dicarboxylate transport system permease large subunit